MKLSQVKDKSIYKLIQGSNDTDYKELVYDSRKVTPGCLFICLKGARFDSHDVIDEIVKSGAAGIVIEHDCTYPDNIDVIKVDNSRVALAHFSAAYFDYPSDKMITIGVTGTKGKTTTTHMIKQLLEKSGKKVGLIGTNGVTIGDTHTPTVNTTPESYELQKSFSDMVKAGCDYMVMEVSSQGIKLHRTEGIEFNYGIFTNISPDHIGTDEHADFDEYLMYKTKLFDNCKKAIVNVDDEHAEYVISHAVCKDMTTFGLDNSADYEMSDIEYVSEKDFVGIGFEVSGKTKLHALVGIPGKFNAYNALAAITVCDMIGVDTKVLSEGLYKIHVNGRMEIAYASDKMKVIIDYAHNAVSMESLLKTLRDYNPKRLVVVFGCGGNRSKDRRYSMGEIGGHMADLSIITADNSRFEKVEDIIADIESSIVKTNGKYMKIPDRKDAIYYSIDHAEQGDIIAIIGKGHEDYQEINGVRHHFLDREVVDEAIASEKAKGRL